MCYVTCVMLMMIMRIIPMVSYIYVQGEFMRHKRPSYIHRLLSCLLNVRQTPQVELQTKTDRVKAYSIFVAHRNLQNSLDFFQSVRVHLPKIGFFSSNANFQFSESCSSTHTKPHTIIIPSALIQSYSVSLQRVIRCNL